MSYYETPYAIQRRRKRVYGAVSFLIGVSIITSAILYAGFPEQVFLWATFAAVFLLLEITAVEVNDRLMTTPTIAVVIAAGIVLGRDQVLGGLTVMAVLGLMQPQDLVQRRIFQPAVNLGIVATGTALTAGVLYLLLPIDAASAGMFRIAAVGAGAAAAGDLASYVLTRFVVLRVFGAKFAGPWSNVGQILLSFVGLGAVGGLLGYAYVTYAAGHGTYNAMLILIVGMLLMSRLFFASLAKLGRHGRECLRRWSRRSKPRTSTREGTPTGLPGSPSSLLKSSASTVTNKSGSGTRR